MVVQKIAMKRPLRAVGGMMLKVEKKIEILEIDETPAYGLETKLKIAINGLLDLKTFSLLIKIFS